MILNSKYGDVKIFTDNVEEKAIGQITQLANSLLGENAQIRIMPDVHAGVGCVVGTTMRISDKVCPNLVGVDIGCGVTLVKTDGQLKGRLEQLDRIIYEKIPFGMRSHDKVIKQAEYLEELRCFRALDRRAQNLGFHALGTLGGGNHFIEAYDNGYISVHSGSRNIGLQVAKYYQQLAEKEVTSQMRAVQHSAIQDIEPSKREQFIASGKQSLSVPRQLSYLTGKNMQDYLHDVGIMQRFAVENRQMMLSTLAKGLKLRIIDTIESIHNYIDLKNMILRKGAISAQEGERLVIPMNMRDGILICRGKGNEDWNWSAPHGAGRLYSRRDAKERFSVSEYKKAMDGIFSSCIGQDTLDEAPFAYKDYREIMDNISPTVDIEARLQPIYNFKAGNE